MSGSTPTRDGIEEFVIAALVKLDVPREDISLDAPFDDIGVDSLQVTEVGQLVKREFGIDVSARDLDEAEALREVLAVIYAKAGV